MARKNKRHAAVQVRHFRHVCKQYASAHGYKFPNAPKNTDLLDICLGLLERHEHISKEEIEHHRPAEKRGVREKPIVRVGRVVKEVMNGKALAAPAPRKKRVSGKLSNAFYKSREWRELRYAVLRQSDGKCEVCGRGKPDGAVLHVDHIKPKSIYPELALDPENLQILCEDCNLGKSNTDEIDWRRGNEIVH